VWEKPAAPVALHLNGMTAPMVIDGPVNRDAFHAYVRHVLKPTLRSGDIVVMDNTPAHRGSETRMRIEAAGCGAALPAALIARLQFNRECQLQAQGTLRKAAERSIDGLWKTIGCGIDQFTPAECANYFTATGYGPE
jgi:hypothetical protein